MDNVHTIINYMNIFMEVDMQNMFRDSNSFIRIYLRAIPEKAKTTTVIINIWPIISETALQSWLITLHLEPLQIDTTF